MNEQVKYVLVEKHQSSALMQVMEIISRNTVKAEGILLPLKRFFGLRTNAYKKSRILRKSHKPFEEFLFKGYDQQHPDITKHSAFKKIKMLCKN